MALTIGICKSTPAAGFVTKQGVRSEILKDITRIVVKLGTGVLTDSRKQPDLAQMEQLVAQVAEQRQAGRERNEIRAKMGIFV